MPGTEAAPAAATTTPAPAPAPAAPAAPAPAAAAPAAPSAEYGRQAAQTHAERQAEQEAFDAAAAAETDKIINRVLKKHGLNEGQNAAPQSEDAPADAEDGTASDAEDAAEDQDDSPEPADAPPQPPEAVLKLLERSGLDPEDLPADPDRQARFIERLKAAEKTAAENGRLRKQLADPAADPNDDKASQTRPAAPAVPELDEAWKALESQFAPFDDDDGTLRKSLRSYVDASAKAASKAVAENVAPLQQLMSLLLDRMEEDDFSRGVDDATFPDGLKKSDEKLRQKIREQAHTLYEAERIRRQRAGKAMTLKDFNLRHAVAQAVPIVFAAQNAAAGKQAAQDRRNRQSAGVPSAGARSPTTQAQMDPDDAEMLRIREHLKNPKYGIDAKQIG